VGQAYQDRAKVQAVLADLDSAPVEDGLRATLRILGFELLSPEGFEAGGKYLLKRGYRCHKARDLRALTWSHVDRFAGKPAPDNCAAS
jgi:hypothetical protein